VTYVLSLSHSLSRSLCLSISLSHTHSHTLSLFLSCRSYVTYVAWAAHRGLPGYTYSMIPTHDN